MSKERPIIFDAESVRAILGGSKTQTRRVVKPQPDHFHLFSDHIMRPQIGQAEIKCPYGWVGDRLWVREAWGMGGGGRNTHIVYRADVADNPGGWYSPIYMPRVNSRITLEVVGVRVERVQDISEADICAELGIPEKWPGPGPEPYERQLHTCWAARWDAINGKRAPWASNPWVWVVEFKRHKEPTE